MEGVYREELEGLREPGAAKREKGRHGGTFPLLLMLDRCCCWAADLLGSGEGRRGNSGDRSGGLLRKEGKDSVGLMKKGGVMSALA
jgi:hypothetical protein